MNSGKPTSRLGGLELEAFMILYGILYLGSLEPGCQNNRIWMSVGVRVTLKSRPTRCERPRCKAVTVHSWNGLSANLEVIIYIISESDIVAH